MQRSESVCAQPGDRIGIIHRPSLLGAIIGKAAALGIPTAPKGKHYRDLAFLLSLPVNPLALVAELTKSDRKKLKLAQALQSESHEAWRALEDPEVRADGQAMYRMLSSTTP